MITTGIIRQINLSSSRYNFNKYLVELNIFQTPGDQNKKHYTYEANCCLPGGLYQSYAVGDVVYVGFINEDLSLPVILGRIYKGVEDETYRTYAQFDNLKVLSNVTLPKTTQIGDVTYEQLEDAVQQTYSQQLQLKQLKEFVANTYSSGPVADDKKEALVNDLRHELPIKVGDIRYNYIRFEGSTPPSLAGKYIYSALNVDSTLSTVKYEYATIIVGADGLPTYIAVTTL